jgi:hypothetical protein
MAISGVYCFSATAAMMADNIEHVISYWVIFQRFHSPALGGFAVISHWIPYLDFSYGMLLAADAAGGLAGGLILETRAIGIHKSLALSATALFSLYAVLFTVRYNRRA